MIDVLKCWLLLDSRGDSMGLTLARWVFGSRGSIFLILIVYILLPSEVRGAFVFMGLAILVWMSAILSQLILHKGSAVRIDIVPRSR